VTSNSSGSFGTGYTATYLNTSLSSVGQVATTGTAAVPLTAVAVRVAPTKTFNAFFAPALGFNTLTVHATATARAYTVTGLDQNDVDYAPYAIWTGEPGNLCADGTYLCNLIGTSHLYRDNNYTNDNVSSGNPNWGGGSNNFKGFLHRGNGWLRVAD